MRYVSTNELESFGFRGAVFANARLDGNIMVWTLAFVNVASANSQNGWGCDMEAGMLDLTFRDYKICRLECLSPSVPKKDIVVLKSAYPDWILSTAAERGHLMDVRAAARTNARPCHTFDINGPAIFRIDVEYSKAEAEWDEYVQKAWYAG